MEEGRLPGMLLPPSFVSSLFQCDLEEGFADRLMISIICTPGAEPELWGSGEALSGPDELVAELCIEE